MAGAATVALSSSLLAAEPGNVGFNFLKVSPGARNGGMGDVVTSVNTSL